MFLDANAHVLYVCVAVQIWSQALIAWQQLLLCIQSFPQYNIALCTDLFPFQPLSIFETIFRKRVGWNISEVLPRLVSQRQFAVPEATVWTISEATVFCFFLSDSGLSKLPRDWIWMLNTHALPYNTFNRFHFAFNAIQLTFYCTGWHSESLRKVSSVRFS